MDAVFELCVGLLMVIAEVTGLTYNEVNVWIFCIIGPALFITLLYFAFRKRKQNIYLIHINMDNKEIEEEE